MIRRILSLLLALVILTAAPAAVAQTAGTSIDIVQANITEHPTVRLAIDVGSASFSEENLTVSENGVPVEFELESVQPIPADYPMAILVDANPERVALAQALAGTLIERKNPADRIRLVPIDAAPGSQISTQSQTLLNIEANSIYASEETRLFDALNGLPKLFGNDLTPQVFVITSGVDTNSLVSKEEALAAIDHMDVTVIALAGGEPEPGILNQIGDRVIPGDDYSILQLEELRFGAVICWESNFPEVFREIVKRGARFMINATNESWFAGTTASDHLPVMVTLRIGE